jgi:hypothetical protein
MVWRSVMRLDSLKTLVASVAVAVIIEEWAKAVEPLGTSSKRAPEVSSEEGPVRSARASWRELCWAGDSSGVLGESVVMIGILVLLVLRWICHEVLPGSGIRICTKEGCHRIRRGKCHQCRSKRLPRSQGRHHRTPLDHSSGSSPRSKKKSTLWI